MKMLGGITDSMTKGVDRIAKDVIERPDGFLIVSTVNTYDMGPETAIIRDSGDNATMPVERYETRELAEAGHKKWCEFAKTATKCQMLGYSGLDWLGGEFALTPFKTRPE